MRGLLIIANYNQEGEIGELLDRVSRSVADHDVVVVDDGSSDKSRELAAARGFLVLAHDRNRGIGAAIRTGINHAIANGYDFVTISSANGKIPPEEVGFVSGPVARGEVDYVQGSRFLEPGRSIGLTRFRRATIPLFNILAWFVLRRRFTDITCGFRTYRVDLFTKHPQVRLDQEWLERYEMEYYIHFWACRLGLRIREVPVTIRYNHLEKGRKSKIKPIVGWWSMIRPFVYLGLGLKR